MKIFFLYFLCSLVLNASELLGKSDKFDLPEFNLKSLNAKIDTGAKTSSIHCSMITPLQNGFVKFVVLDKNNKKFTGDFITKKISRITAVKSSNGISQTRYFIKTPIIIYGKKYMMEVSLSFRKNMKFPLLIGRELIKQNFIVDVTKKNLSFNKQSQL